MNDAPLDRFADCVTAAALEIFKELPACTSETGSGRALHFCFWELM
jgi:hypothetical protein